jgi:uncharacterized HhH-GPD family protein
VAKLSLAQDPGADKLLSKDPLALLIGMVLDQQVPLEKAFRGPFDLLPRLGVKKLDARELAGWNPEEFVQAFVRVPALHRYPAAMAKRVQDLCQVLVAEYGGKAENVWNGARTGDELLRRIKALPGFGEQKARIFVALLAKQLGVKPPGWEEASGVYGEPGSYRSVADIVGPESLEKVRAFKAQMKKAAKAAK